MRNTVLSKSSALKEYLKLVAALPRIGEEAQLSLERDLRVGNGDAALALTESFLPTVVAEAAARRGQGLRFEALIAAGNRGLAEALRGGKGTLLVRVRREIRRSLRETLSRVKSRRPSVW